MRHHTQPHSLLALSIPYLGFRHHLYSPSYRLLIVFPTPHLTLTERLSREDQKEKQSKEQQYTYLARLLWAAEDSGTDRQADHPLNTYSPVDIDRHRHTDRQAHTHTRMHAVLGRGLLSCGIPPCFHGDTLGLRDWLSLGASMCLGAFSTLKSGS